MNFSLRNFLHALISSSLLGPDILLSIVFLNILRLRAFLRASNGEETHVHKLFIDKNIRR